MTVPTLDELFDSFTATALRVETLPAYAVGGEEAERIAAWREGRPRPERSVRTNAYLRRIAVTTAAGKRWRRIRVLDDPLTEYQRYQLGSYVESQAAGEEVLIVDRVAAGDVADFWLFDDVTAALMAYSPDGRFEGIRMADPCETAACAETAHALAAAATPLNVFLAGRVGV